MCVTNCRIDTLSHYKILCACSLSMQQCHRNTKLLRCREAWWWPGCNTTVSWTSDWAHPCGTSRPGGEGDDCREVSNYTCTHVIHIVTLLHQTTLFSLLADFEGYRTLGRAEENTTSMCFLRCALIWQYSGGKCNVHLMFLLKLTNHNSTP